MPQLSVPGIPTERAFFITLREALTFTLRIFPPQTYFLAVAAAMAIAVGSVQPSAIVSSSFRIFKNFSSSIFASHQN